MTCEEERKKLMEALEGLLVFEDDANGGSIWYNGNNYDMAVEKAKAILAEIKAEGRR